MPGVNNTGSAVYVETCSHESGKTSNDNDCLSTTDASVESACSSIDALVDSYCPFDAALHIVDHLEDCVICQVYPMSHVPYLNSVDY